MEAGLAGDLLIVVQDQCERWGQVGKQLTEKPVGEDRQIAEILG